MLQCVERVIQGHPVYEEHYLQCFCAARKEREDENTDIRTGCPKCKKLAEMAEKVAQELDLDYEIEKVTDIKEIMSFGVLGLPALL